MRFQTRAFFICFVPVAILLAVSSWIVQRVVQSTVRVGVATSLRQNQLEISNLQTRSDLQNNRFFSIVGDNAALKAGLELVTTEANSEAARRTVEDQLLELGEHMGFDLLLVTGADGKPLAGVIRGTGRSDAGPGSLRPLTKSLLPEMKTGLLLIDGQPYQIASMPIDGGASNLGMVSVGERFDLSAFSTPTLLLHDGAIVMSSVPGASIPEVQSALGTCAGELDCTLKLHGSDWISIAAPGFTTNQEYVLRSLQDVDAAFRPMQVRLERTFLLVGVSSLVIVFLCSVISARSVVKPIDELVAHLRIAAQTGVLEEYERGSSKIVEIQELAESYNRAMGSVKNAQDSLQSAYIEFVGSLANALDARDPYTAGHSLRVSEVACAIAVELKLSSEQIDQIRIGALLHDVGKIGIVDSVLQKPGMLTKEEFDAIKHHPVIGRRILEGVQGFARFLPAVELHHENWDGTGYPTRQAGEQVPIDARIIHVADAYDAMTTDRSYRNGMSHEIAMRRLIENAGTQFDPLIVRTWQTISQTFDARQPRNASVEMDMREQLVEVS